MDFFIHDYSCNRANCLTTDNCNCLTLNIHVHVRYELQSPEAIHE